MDRRTVLLVDDEVVIRMMLAEMLAMGGYVTEAAESGEAALDILRKKNRDVGFVILDIIMPGMGGKKAFYAIKHAYPEIAVLLSSGYGRDDDISELLRDGAAGFIQKPYTVGELMSTVRGLVPQSDILSR